MQLAGHLGGALALLARRFPQPLQRAPHRLPVLRRGFHDDLLDLLLDHPLRQHVQLFGRRAELAPFKLILALAGYVRHHYR
jgi:hypothetical protein